MNAHPLLERLVRPRRGLWCAAALLFTTSSLTLAAGPLDNQNRLISESTTTPVAHDVYHRGAVIDDSELAQMRGGFTISGMELSFGIQMKSMIDNVRYETGVRLTRSGPQVIYQTLNDPSGSAVRVGSGTGNSVADITPNGINLEGLANHFGVVLNDSSGFTALLHNVTRKAITSTTVSNASGMTIDNLVNIQVEVHNMSDLRAARQREAIIRSIQGF